MAQIILVRPGLTDYDQQIRIQGTLDISLSEAGLRQAVKLTEKLRQYSPTAVYSAQGRSAKETASAIAAGLGLKPKTLDKLTNVNLGLWQGMLVEEVRHKQPKVYKQWQEHPETVRPPEGEELPNTLERIEDSLEKIARKHRMATVVLVAPEPLASLLRQMVDGSAMGDLWKATNGCDRCELLNLEPTFTAAGHENGKSAAKRSANGFDTLMYRGPIVDKS